MPGTGSHPRWGERHSRCIAGEEEAATAAVREATPCCRLVSSAQDNITPKWGAQKFGDRPWESEDV